MQHDLMRVMEGFEWEIHKIGEGLIDTSKGKKKVVFWPNKIIAEWSHSWREAVARAGYRPVERFIPDKHGEVIHETDNGCLTISDYFEGPCPNPNIPEDCQLLGRILARIHLALKTKEELKKPVSFITRIKNYLMMLDYLREAILGNGKDSLMDDVIVRNLPQLEQRLKRAGQLAEGIERGEKEFLLSHARFDRRNVLSAAASWYIHGLEKEELDYLHADTVHLIRDIYREQWDVHSIMRFIAGYEELRSLTKEELIYILVRLIVPYDIIRMLESYPDGLASDEQIETLFECYREQVHWDRLLQAFALLIDKRNEVSA